MLVGLGTGDPNTEELGHHCTLLGFSENNLLAKKIRHPLEESLRFLSITVYIHKKQQ